MLERVFRFAHALKVYNMKKTLFWNKPIIVTVVDTFDARRTYGWGLHSLLLEKFNQHLMSAGNIWPGKSTTHNTA